MGFRPAADLTAHGTGLAAALITALVVTLGCVIAGPVLADPAIEPLEHFPSADLTVESHGHGHHFRVRLATTEARHEQGLMYVKQMPRDEGMLFLWDSPRPESFWMKNTYLSLDLLFIAADGTIIHIAPNAEPLSEALISSMGPVLGVLEVNAGTAKRLGIATGDRVRYPAFAPR